MTISSRTPEVTPNECPICGVTIKLEPSTPTGDAPCPSCGSLLWFTVQQSDVFYSDKPASTEDGSATEPDMHVGARVRIKVGTFEGREGEVAAIDTENKSIQMMLNLFGRPMPVEMEASWVEVV